MDHLEENIKEYMQMDVVRFYQEYCSGLYESIEKCPTYALVSVYCEVLRPIEVYLEYELTTPDGIVYAIETTGYWNGYKIKVD